MSGSIKRKICRVLFDISVSLKSGKTLHAKQTHYGAAKISFDRKGKGVNKSWYIALFVASESIKKLFSVDRVNIYFFQPIVNFHFSIFFEQI